VFLNTLPRPARTETLAAVLSILIRLSHGTSERRF